jgi:hypothetical protein
MNTVPINVILENLPNPIRVTGFDLNKINDVTYTKNNTPAAKIFTFSPKSIRSFHLDSDCKTKV